MSSPFVYELASVMAAITRDHPEHPSDPYALPWYLVVGDPGSGRSTAIRSMALTWPQGGDGILRINLPQQLCTYWLASEAVFVEPEAAVVGPRRESQRLLDLATELRGIRPREPIDGILLVANIAEFIDLDDQALEAYGLRLRSYLVEAANGVSSDVPVYLILTRYDTLWGFAEVFQWGPERSKEEPWGFQIPVETPIEQGLEQMNKGLQGLLARIEAYCLAKLASEDPAEQRTRAFQHLAEVHAMMDKLQMLFKHLALKNAYERTPWFRAVGVGAGVPGMGDRIRAGVTRFMNMGLSQGPNMGGAPRPGGLPLFHFMKTAVLPEKNLVPLRTRWRDDKFIVFSALIGAGLLLLGVIAALVFAMLKK
jgi:type VI protein secretion system component VasK